MGSNDASPFPLVGGAALVALRRWRLALALYLPSLLLGLLAAAPVFLAGDALARLGPWTARLAAGDFLNTFFELSAMRLGQEPPAEARAAVGDLVQAVLVLPLVILLHGLLYNLLAGGVLAGLSGQSADSFWRALRRWAWPMLWFGLLALPLFLALGGLGLTLVALLPLGEALTWLQLVLALAWLACLDGLLELARADMVARGDRRALHALGRALALPARPGLFLRVLAVWLLLGLAGLVFALLNGNVTLGLPAVWPLLLLAATQALALAGAWLKLLRLAAALGLARAARPSEA